MHRKYCTSQKWSFTRFQKKIFLTLQIRFWLFWSVILKSRQNSLSPHANRLVCVVWSHKLYQTIPWILSNVFYMHNMSWKCTESILRDKNEASHASEKSFFWRSKVDFGSGGVSFFKKSTKFTFSWRESTCMCRVVPKIIWKDSLDLKQCFLHA